MKAYTFDCWLSKLPFVFAHNYADFPKYHVLGLGLKLEEYLFIVSSNLMNSWFFSPVCELRSCIDFGLSCLKKQIISLYLLKF